MVVGAGSGDAVDVCPLSVSLPPEATATPVAAAAPPPTMTPIVAPEMPPDAPPAAAPTATVLPVVVTKLEIPAGWNPAGIGGWFATVARSVSDAGVLAASRRTPQPVSLTRAENCSDCVGSNVPERKNR